MFKENNDTSFEINLGHFDTDFKTKVSADFDTRYIKPKYHHVPPERYAKYARAEDLAKVTDLSDGSRMFAIINGSFIFGDYIEALAVTYDLGIKEMTISTLSFSENNVDSLANLMNGGYLDHLNVIVSDYFFSHERNNLIRYAYKELDIDNRFQLSVAATHCKMTIFEIDDGRKVVIHGSANLRSSGNIEQICIEVNSDLYIFNFEYQQKIIEEYKSIDKSVRYNNLWDTIT